MEDIGYYFTNWNTDVISIGIIICLVLLLSGYFWGKLFQRFAKSLKNVDATFLGIFFIMAIFQVFVFACVPLRLNTDICYYLLPVLVFLGPILCLVFKANVIPTWKNLFSVLLGIFISFVLCWASSKLNTNNIFFDSVTYLSEVIECIDKEFFGYMAYVKGMYTGRIDALHDYTGYYYFWAMLLKWARNLLDIKTFMTPIYIWGGTVFYGLAIANLVISSVNILFDKWFKWFGVIIAVLILAPYYTNYFNTTLAFFGNTMRSVMIGWAVLLVYLFTKEKENTLFPILVIVYYAAINASSSSFFLCAMIIAGLFFYLAIQKKTGFKTWIWFILSCTPVLHYGLLIAGPFSTQYFITLGIVIATLLVLIIIAILLRNHMKYFNAFGMILLPITIIALIVISYTLKDSDYGYSFYFALRSIDDMTVNITNYIDHNEWIRNIILYILLVCLVLNFKFEKSFKIFLLVVGLLFLNPLVQPVVSNYITAQVYSRSFDIIINPFVITFMIYNFSKLFSEKTKYVKYINYALLFAVLPVAGYFSYQFGYHNLTHPYSLTLVPFQEDYNWKYKVTEDSMDMYTYIKNTILKKMKDPTVEDYNLRHYEFISQDVNMKAYVENVRVTFSALNYRQALNNVEKGTYGYDFISLFYPDKRFEQDGVTDIEADYSRLQNVLLDSNADYLIMNNTLAVWNERGWFDKVYAQILFDGVVKKEYENTSWVLFKINHDWKPKPVEEPKDDTECIDDEECEVEVEEVVTQPVTPQQTPTQQVVQDVEEPQEEYYQEGSEEIVEPEG